MLACVESAGEETGKRTCHALHVRTVNGPLKLRLWDLGNRSSFPAVGSFLELRIHNLSEAEKELEKWFSLSLDTTSNKTINCGFVPVNEEDVPEDVRKKVKRDIPAQKMKALEILKNDSYWKDKRLHAFLLDFFKRNVEKITIVPAATDNHHAYKGGLFIHTAHVFSKCHGIVNNPMMEFDNIDSDVLYMAAWFHDMGKIEVYSMDGDVTRIDSDRENLFGHITLGDRIFRREAETAGLDPKFIDAVSHCILSHHGNPEWGAVVAPLTIEAIILFHIDFINSRQD